MLNKPTRLDLMNKLIFRRRSVKAAALKGHAAAHYLTARVMTLALLAITLATGVLLLRPASAHAQAQEQQTAGMQGSTTVQTATTVPRIDVFARGTDNQLWHRWFFNGWHDWETLGRHLDSAPTATLDPTDTAVINVFYRDGGDIWRGRISVSDNRASWDNLGHECEHSIIGFCTSPLTSAPAATSNRQQGNSKPGRLDVFAFAGDHGLMHKWLKPVYNFGAIAGYTWSDWEVLSNADFSGDPAAVSWGPGRIDVFVHGSSGNALEHMFFDNGSWHGGWEDLGGTILYSPTVASWSQFRLDVFAVGTDNQLWHKWFDGGKWADWEPLGGLLTSSPTAASWGSGRLDVFARGGDNAMHHKWFDGGNWANWEPLGSNLTSAPGAVGSVQG